MARIADRMAVDLDRARLDQGFKTRADNSARWRASTRSKFWPASSGATRTDVGVGEDDAEGGVMNVSGARRRANLSIVGEPLSSRRRQLWPARASSC